MTLPNQRVRSFVALGATLVWLGCSNTGNDFGAVGVDGNKRKTSESAAYAGSGSEVEEELADEPVQVSGAFLACAFMDSESEVKAKAQNEPNADVEIPCGLYHRNTGKRVDSGDLNYKWKIYTSVNETIEFAANKQRAMPMNSDFHTALSVPFKLLMGAIVVELQGVEGKRAVRMRSIPTIRQFGMRYKRFDARAELQMLGLIAGGTAEVYDGGGGKKSSISDTTASGVKFWDVFNSVANAIQENYPPEYAKAATDSRGDEQYMQSTSSTGQNQYVIPKSSSTSGTKPGTATQPPASTPTPTPTSPPAPQPTPPPAPEPEATTPPPPAAATPPPAESP